MKFELFVATRYLRAKRRQAVIGVITAISIAGVYQPTNGQLADVEGAGGVSPTDASPDFRAREANYAAAWFRTITAQTFA